MVEVARDDCHAQASWAPVATRHGPCLRARCQVVRETDDGLRVMGAVRNWQGRQALVDNAMVDAKRLRVAADVALVVFTAEDRDLRLQRSLEDAWHVQPEES